MELLGLEPVSLSIKEEWMTMVWTCQTKRCSSTSRGIWRWRLREHSRGDIQEDYQGDCGLCATWHIHMCIIGKINNGRKVSGLNPYMVKQPSGQSKRSIFTQTKNQLCKPQQFSENDHVGFLWHRDKIFLTEYAEFLMPALPPPHSLLNIVHSNSNRKWTSWATISSLFFFWGGA